jgi:hypothetical protein
MDTCRDVACGIRPYPDWMNVHLRAAGCFHCVTLSHLFFAKLPGTYLNNRDDVLDRPGTRAGMLRTTPLRPTRPETLGIKVGSFPNPSAGAGQIYY